MKEKEVAADLHVHTTASDGLYSPAEVAEMATTIGLSAIAITDHDTVDGIIPARRSSRRLEVIPGIELSTEYAGHEIHILGYYIDTGHPRLMRLLRELRQSRVGRAEKMVARLAELGYGIELERVCQIAGKAAPGRPHIARALLEKGFIESVRQAFDTLLAYGGPAYVERFKLTPCEAIELVKEAGGVAVLAHPGLSGVEALIEDLVKSGLQGLEARHPEHDAEQVERFSALAGALGLIVTGGSDYHGGQSSTGGELASCGVDRKTLSLLRAAALAGKTPKIKKRIF